jgi:hypoxia up-regulated 1
MFILFLNNISTPLPLAICMCLISLHEFNHVVISNRYSSRNLSAPIKANLHFSLSRSGIISLDRAEAVIEITEWVEVPKKNLTLESNSTSQTLSSEGGAANDTSDSKENVSSDGDANKSSAPIDESNAQDIVTEKVLKKRTFRVPLKVKIEGHKSGVNIDRT